MNYSELLHKQAVSNFADEYNKFKQNMMGLVQGNGNTNSVSVLMEGGSARESSKIINIQTSSFKGGKIKRKRRPQSSHLKKEMSPGEIPEFI